MQLKSRFGGLSWAVFAIMLAGLGFSLIGWLVIGLEILRQSTDQALQERLSLAQVIASRVDDHLKQSLHSMEALIETEGIADRFDDPQAREEFLKDVRHQLGDFEYYTVLLDTNRKIVGQSPYIEAVAENDFGSAKCVEFVSVNQTPVITRAFELGAPTPTVAMVFPILTSDRRLVGVVFTALNLNYSGFTRLLQTAGPGSTGYTEVVDSTGVVLGATNPERLWQADDHGDQFDKLIIDKRSVVGTCHHCHVEGESVVDRQDDVMAFAPLNAAKWGVALRQSKRETFAFTSMLRQRIALFGVLSVLAIGLSTALLTRQIVKPVVELTGACQEIAAGNLDASIPLHGPGEVGKLATAFDFMRAKLKSSLDQIQSWAEELEGRIRQRTGELQESQDKLVKANLELSALNTVGDALRESLDLNATMATALQRVVEMAEADAGCIFLNDPVNREPTLAAFLTRNSDQPCLRYSSLTRPSVMEVFQKERTDVFKLPIRMAEESGNGSGETVQALTTFIPLVGKESLPGVMVLVKDDGCGVSNHERGLYESIGAQIGISIENGMLFKALVQKEESLSQLLHKLIVAQEEERRRIARELHDETSQSLTALSVGLKTAMMAPASHPDEIKKRLASLEVLASSMHGEISRMIQDLRPSLLDDLGLLSAIDWYADIRLRSTGIQVSLEVLGVEHRFPNELETTLFRLAQEAISNVARHAQAESVNVLLEYGKGHVILEIEDDGQGFEVKEVLSGDRSDRAHGLLGMRERVDLFGGTLTITSQVGSGTHVRVEIPIEIPAKMRA